MTAAPPFFFRQAKFSLGIGLLALILCTLSSFGQSNIHRADDLLASGKSKEAILLLEEEIERLPFSRDANLFFKAACARSLNGDYEAASIHLYHAMQADFSDYATLMNHPDLSGLRQSAHWSFLLQYFKSRYANNGPFYWGIYAGILFIILVYNVMLFLSTKDRTFVFSALLLVFSGHYEIFRNQEFGLFIFSNLTGWKYFSGLINPVNFFISMSALSLTVYLQSLLRLKELLPRMNQVLSFLALLFTAFAILSAVSRININSFVFLSVSVTLLFYFIVGIVSWAKGYQPARFFVIADIIFIICVLSILFNYLGLVDSVMQIGQFKARHIGLISFYGLITLATGDKIITLQKEKELAQEKALEVLEQKVKERTREVVEQKQLVEEKQKEILESISYARRIQEAILPPEDLISAEIPRSFILYLPKDLVAGDFYWSEKIGDEFLIAAADSTGHGVPGAMVSVVCSNALNRAVKEFKLSEPGKILDKTRELVVETFEKSYSDVKDGMDISLLAINQKKKSVKWSGANNPLWYVNASGIHEHKASKQPIGKSDITQPFINLDIPYESGTWFYLFTDGYADQFGGPKGKKFKYKSFMDLIHEASSLPAQEQSALLLERFIEWKQQLDQVDDICVIGIQLP